MKRASVSILVLSLSGCGHLRTPLRQDLVDAEFVVPREDARSATVSLETPGELAVRGGSCSLVKARARYDAARTDARTAFEVDESGHGSVVIALEKSVRPFSEASVDACLTTEIPLQLQAVAGVGDARFDLSGIQLRAFEVASGVGDVAVDFGDASVAAPSMTIEAGTGDVTIDAKRGTWTGENHLDIEAGTGDITVYLPRGIGLHVEVERGIGGLEVRGLDKDGDDYVNTLAASAEDRLEVEIEVGTGDVTVIAG